MKIVKGQEQHKGIELLNFWRLALLGEDSLKKKFDIGLEIRRHKRDLINLGVIEDEEVTTWFNSGVFVREVMEYPERWPDAYEYLKANQLLIEPRIGVA